MIQLNKIYSNLIYYNVLASDGRIIVFGGTKYLTKFAAKPSLMVLDTNTLPYKWTVPQVFNINNMPTLAAHTANIIDKYMIVAFGKFNTCIQYINYKIIIFFSVL